MKKIRCILLFFLFLLGIPATSLAAQEITVVVDGQAVEFAHPPVLEGNRMLVPMREIFTALGATVSWDDPTKTAAAVRDNVKINIPLGSYLPTVNDIPIAIDVPAISIGNRTYIPLRFAALSLGCQLDWKAAEMTAFITTAAAEQEQDAAQEYEAEQPSQEHIAFREEGMACWYGEEFHGRKTSSGEVYDQQLHTAAHRTLPFGTMVRVTFPETGRSVWVRINDRGPHNPKRIIDLSRGAADALGLTSFGIGRVELEVFGEK